MFINKNLTIASNFTFDMRERFFRDLFFPSSVITKPTIITKKEKA